MFTYCDKIRKELFFFWGVSLFLLLFFLIEEPFFIREEPLGRESTPPFRNSYPPFANVFFPESPPFVSLPDLHQEIEIYEIPKRPEESRETFLLILKQAHKKKVGVFSEKIPLFYDKTGILQITEKNSSFWIKPRKEKGEIVVEAVLENATLGKEERFCFPLRKASFKNSTKFLEQIGDIAYVGEDLWEKSQGRDVFVLEQKGELAFLAKEALWGIIEGRLVEKKGTDAKDLVAKVKGVSKEGLEVEFWGEEGEYLEKFFPVARLCGEKESFFEIEKNLRPYNFHKIVYSLPKGILFLKEKEALVKREKDWEKNKEKERKKPGELFFFEKIERRGIEKVICGYWFDFTHTKKQEVRISFDGLGKRSFLKNEEEMR